jgi:hypothetical protein
MPVLYPWDMIDREYTDIKSLTGRQAGGHLHQSPLTFATQIPVLMVHTVKDSLTRLRRPPGGFIGYTSGGLVILYL